ncbi:MAG: FAD-dependent oxidoreductase [bacterium]|nr:FAD-dependent oxidoreductase [bacterium]
MTQAFDVLIVGGGVVGLTAALAMAQRNYQVALIDSGSLTADTSIVDLRVYAINKASQALLSQLAVWPHLDAVRLSPYHHMHVWDGINGAAIDFDSRSIGAANLGFIIEEALLKNALLAQIKSQPQIHLFPQQSINEVINLADNIRIGSAQNSWQGQLLMIADGAHSPTRQKLQVDMHSWPYNQHALVATVACEKSHQHTAYQVFNPQGPLAFLPLVDPRQCSIVWSTEPNHAKHLMKIDAQEFNNELTHAFGEKLGQVQLISERHHFPLHMRHVKQYSGSHWMIMGDAAHTIHPLAGLGLNVGLADVAAWLKCLDAHKGTLNGRKVLGSYQRERKNAVWQTIALMEGFKRIFSHSALPISALRGLGLRACNELTPLKRLFIQHAAGL